MKYSILIDQRNLAERFPTLNLADAALLAFCADAFASPRIETRDIEGKRYWWLRYAWIATEMPLLNVTNPEVIGRRMRTLREAGLIETVVVDGLKAMHRPGPRWDELTGMTAPDQGGVPTQKETPADSKRGGVPTQKEAPVYKGLDHEDQTTKPNPPTPQGGTLPGGFSKKPAAVSKAKSRDHESANHYPADWQDDLPFTTALADYFRSRREKRQPATPTAAELTRKKLLAAGIETATLALQQSAANGWTGVFPDKINRTPPNQKPGASEPQASLW